MRTRRDVWKLSSSDKTLFWYGVVVSEMQNRLFANPLSWIFQAAVHGYQAKLYPPGTAANPLPLAAVQKTYWGQCMHASWSFLPWHRIYVFFFEQICRDVIVSKGGPADWALPYWDYSHAKGTSERTLPGAFRDKTAAGNPNPLYVSPRGAGVNSGKAVGSDAQSENSTCMKSVFFSSPTIAGFGGVTPPGPHGGNSSGTCESGPHNTMHDAIGGQGWMDDIITAARDPIFWLHHANIDRLWVVWRKRDPGNVNPTDASWLNAKFDFYDNNGKPQKFSATDVLDTTGPLCDYDYEDTSDPLAPGKPGAVVPSATAGRGTEGGFRGSFLEGLRMNAQRTPEMVGASTGPGVTLDSGVSSVQIPLRPPTPLAERLRGLQSAEAQQASQRVHLNLENIRALERPIHTYEVYLNVPAGDAPAKHPELMAGLIPRFGLIEASQRDDKHGGQGLNYSFDVTDIVSALEAKKAWNPEQLKVTFAPHDLAEVAAEAEGQAAAKRQPVQVGRVSLYYQ